MDQSENEETRLPNLKERLVQVATELLVGHRGVKLPTMRQIASAAGVAPGAAYRHFSSQEELFIAVISELFADLEATLSAAIQQSRGLRSQVRNIAQSYVSWGLENPGGYQLLFETTDKEGFPETEQRPGLHLLDQFAGLLPGKLGQNSKQTQKITLVWISLHGLISLRIHKTGMPWPNTVEQDVDLILKAILKPI